MKCIFKIGFDTLRTVCTTAYRSLASAKIYWVFIYILIYVVAERLNTNLFSFHINTMCSLSPLASKKLLFPLHDIDLLLSPYQVKGDASDHQGWAHACTCSMHGVGTDTQMYIWYTCETKGKKEASPYKNDSHPHIQKQWFSPLGHEDMDGRVASISVHRQKAVASPFLVQTCGTRFNKSHFTHTR